MPIEDWGEHISQFLTPEEVAAVEMFRDKFSIDITRTYQFHEALVARLMDGKLTDHRCGWDVQRDDIRIEVKFSAETNVLFRQGRRPVFKFAMPTGSGLVAKQADVTVFVGIDRDDALWAWVVPTRYVRRAASITVTSPRVRIGNDRSDIGAWLVPYSQLLPEVLHCARSHRAHSA